MTAIVSQDASPSIGGRRGGDGAAITRFTFKALN